MTNPDNVGGLPKLPEPERYVGNDVFGTLQPRYTASQMRAYGELCRAAPAGGDVPSWRNVGSAIDAKALATATEIALMWGNDRSQFVSRIQVAVIDAMRWMGESDCQRSTHHVHRGPESLPCYCAGTNDHPIGQEVAKDSAPAGSGEVDLMVQQLEERAKWFREEKGHDATLLRQCAALLRKLSQAGSGEVEPLPVFSGNWIYVDTGQRFSGADLDGAAFAVYEPHLRKLQQGAE